MITISHWGLHQLYIRMRLWDPVLKIEVIEWVALEEESESEGRADSGQHKT